MSTKSDNSGAIVFAGTVIACAVCPPLWFVAIPAALFGLVVAANSESPADAVTDVADRHQAALEALKPSNLVAAMEREEAQERRNNAPAKKLSFVERMGADAVRRSK